MNKKTGWAIIGLSKLVIDEVLPAFNLCKHANIVALVSGDDKKATGVATQYGINKKSIYSYDNFDEIKDNTEIDVVYIVLPNSQHKDFMIDSKH